MPAESTPSASGAALRVGDALARTTARLRTAGSESARLDAELLLGSVLGVDRTTVLAHPDAPIGPGPADALAHVVERRAAGEPVAYLRGFKEFHGLAITVDRRVLVPRPETETLVDLALDRIAAALTAAPRPPDAPRLRIWDAGTGSGAIAVALAVALRRRRFGGAVHIVATDASSDALAVAVENLVGHGAADIVESHHGDLADARGGLPDGPRVDLVVANLPYIPTADVVTLPVAASFEPVVALDGGPDGLDLVRRLLGVLPDVVTPGGSALLEIGSTQADAATTAAAELLPEWSAEVHADLSGRPRVLEVRDAAGSANGGAVDAARTMRR